MNRSASIGSSALAFVFAVNACADSPTAPTPDAAPTDPVHSTEAPGSPKTPSATSPDAAGVAPPLPTAPDAAKSHPKVPGMESRCAELDVDCICSEPFDTTSYVRLGSSWFNPGDSTAKECSATPEASLKGGAVERNLSDVVGSSDAVALSKLPPGHAIQHFVRGADDHLGIFSIGHGMGVALDRSARAAARFYLYHSPAFDFAQDGSCQNSKLAQFGSAGLLDKSYGYVHMYNFLTWSPASDCCMSGPGPSNVTRDDWRGRWWRVEIVFTKLDGPGFNAQVYMKNVTDGAPEIKVVDLAYGPTVDWTPAPNLMPPTRMDSIMINAFRSVPNPSTDRCRGWEGISHYLFAAWRTDAGQRIEGAYEIEGG